MDVLIVARRIGNFWEPTATIHRDLKSAKNELTFIRGLYPEREYSILTINLEAATEVPTE